MNSPSSKDTRMNRADMKVMANSEPSNGTFSTKRDSSSMEAILMQLIRKYGIAFAVMIMPGWTGPVSNSSIEPYSFSRTIDTLVITAHTIISTSPIMPGTK